MKLKEKKTLGYAIFSILMIVLLSMYLGKADYEKINEASKQGLYDAKDNSVRIAKKLKAYIYDIVDEKTTSQEDKKSIHIKKIAKIKKNAIKPVKLLKHQAGTRNSSKVKVSKVPIDDSLTKKQKQGINL